MIPLRTTFLVFVLISGLIFIPPYSFAQTNQDENPFSSIFEIFKQLFSFGDKKPEPITEFSETTIIQISGTSSIDITENNVPPTANAGPDQTVLEFTTVILDGSSSTDVNGDILSFEWSQTNGPIVTLSSSTIVNPTFISPDVNSDVILIFNLKVTDDDGAIDDDDVEVNVKDTNDGNTDDDLDGNTDDDLDGNTDDDLDGNTDDDLDGNTDDDLDGNTDDDLDGNKVTICHIPPGNPNNSHTIRVGESSVNTHLTHGDTLGECNENKSDDDHDDGDNENRNDNSNVNNSGQENKKEKENNKNKFDDDHDDGDIENRNGNSNNENKNKNTDKDDEDKKKDND